MAKAMDVAKFLIQLRDLDEEKGHYYSLSNLKLQKLLYYCQGGHYRWDNERLITDRLFEAWDYGPVIDEVYQNFKKFGQNDIYTSSLNNNLNPNEQETILLVWDQLKNKHAFELVALTHDEIPWKYANKHNNIFIDEQHIREFFLEDEEVTQ